MFIDNIAVCSSDTFKFIRAFSKHYITEETKLITAVPGTESSGQCRFSITHQFPFGSKCIKQYYIKLVFNSAFNYHDKIK